MMMLKQMIGAASLFLAMQGAAVAQDAMPSVRIAYGDLNLSNPADVRRLDLRIDRAISTLCPDHRSYGGLKAMRVCWKAKREQIAAARAQALASASSRGEATVAAR
jgi:UrcA family protein